MLSLPSRTASGEGDKPWHCECRQARTAGQIIWQAKGLDTTIKDGCHLFSVKRCSKVHTPLFICNNRQ